MPPLNKDTLYWFYIGGCVGFIIGAELAKRRARINHEQSREFERRGKETLDAFEEQRKKAEDEFAARIADKVVQGVKSL
jgi:hypothetical protein